MKFTCTSLNLKSFLHFDLKAKKKSGQKIETVASGELVSKMFEAMCYCVFTTAEVCFQGSLFLSYVLDMQSLGRDFRYSPNSGEWPPLCVAQSIAEC